MSERTDPHPDPDDETTTVSIADAGVGLLGPTTAQVAVPLPVEHVEDDLVEDDVPAEEVVDAEIVAEQPAPVAAHVLTREPEPAPAASVAPTTAEQPVLRRHAPVTAPVTLAAKRVGEREADRESADLLTDDRLVAPGRLPAPDPDGLWPQLLYALSGRRVNLGDSKGARKRKALDARIAAHLPGGARFVAVLSRKGGVGKTTVTTLLGMALADAREDRVIAIDANPDRGTLADRIGAAKGRTVRDLARARVDVDGFNQFSGVVARDRTRLDVLASDADPHVSDALSDADYREVAALAAHYYSVVLTDTGTGIVHSATTAALAASDALVVVTGLSVDEARLASETLTWLETNGYADAVRDAVVVINASRPGTPLVRAEEVEGHFRTRVRSVLRLPYDPLIATGGEIAFRELQPATRTAARELAAAVVEGLGAPVRTR
ncbi:MAG: AAA family ATPase [Microbacterium sp.]